MSGSNLKFTLGDRIRIEGNDYIVKGSITFLNGADNYTWTEYKIVSTSYSVVKWLSIDNTYEEHAIYTQCRYNKEFQEDNILAEGYKEADYGIARVIDYMGDVDVDLNEEVSFREFEDFSEENIIAIESWEDEKEYSKGHYLNNEDIEEIEEATRNLSTSSDNEDRSLFGSYGFYNHRNTDKTKAIIAAVVAAVLLIGGIVIWSSGNSTTIAKFLASNNSFRYTTSITADIDNSQKADVYTTVMSIEETSKLIIDELKGKVEDVQENTEDLTVAIITDKEYCLIYSGAEGGTLVQISSRLYTYSSTNEPYRARSSTGYYYRRFYYTAAYSRDNSRYGGHANGYSNYQDGTINTNPNNRYKSYTNSIRQESTSSRTSSGGGTSFGK